MTDGVHRIMKRTRSRLTSLFLALMIATAVCFAAQDSSAPPPKTPAQSDEPTRLTIEVTGGENAVVYVKYVEEHTMKKDKKVELNVKTNRAGVAYVAEAPLGRALVQIIAEGW